MKFRLAFRSKLILTIFPVVAGISIAVLLIAERKFSDAQQQLFEEQFEGQFNSLIQSRKERSDTLGQDLRALARTPDLIAAIKNGKKQDAWNLLFPHLEKLALDALSMQMGRQGQAVETPQMRTQFSNGPRSVDRGRPGGDRADVKGSRLPPMMAPFIGIVDPEGSFVKIQKAKQSPDRGPENEAELRRRSGALRWLANKKLAEVLADQETGYLLVESTDGKAAQVREIFVTPLRSGDGAEFFGAFVFGLPLPTNQERVLYEQSKHNDLGKIMSGIWVEDSLVSSTVPEKQHENVAGIVSRELQKSSKPGRELTVTIDGKRHRIMYRVLNPGSPFPLAAQVSLYSLATLDQEIGDLRKSVAGLGAVALLVALAAVFFISRSLSGPIQQLSRGTREIELGNFDYRVNVKGRDELGALAASFNEMAAGLALQEKYRSILNAVADQTVARELIENKSALGGELRDVAILFCDIRGFTALTEGMPPQDVIVLLNEHMTALTSVAYDHGGIVDKFVGDLLMVLFGAPQSSVDDAARAVRCAWKMLSVRRDLNETSMHPFEVGIGIATGGVVAGCMGSEQRLSYTVVGERVNLASRLCDIAQAGELIIDEATLCAVTDLVEAERRPPIPMKGFKEPVATFRITSVSGTADQEKPNGESHPALAQATASVPL